MVKVVSGWFSYMMSGVQVPLSCLAKDGCRINIWLNAECCFGQFFIYNVYCLGWFLPNKRMIAQLL